LADLFEYMMMHGLTNPKHIRWFKKFIYTLKKHTGCFLWIGLHVLIILIVG
jgi:hypothetical protein